MKIIKKTNRITAFLSIAIAALLIMSVSASAADQSSDETVQPMIVCLKGNISYYAGVGDKVKKGDPLFLVVTVDNNPALFYRIIHKIQYYTKMYNRRAELIKAHAVSSEEFETNLNNLILAKDELVSFIAKFKQGLYIAPYDCEIVSVPYPNGCGIKDGYVAMTLKPVDPNYKFEPKKTNEKVMELYKATNEFSQEQSDKLNVDDVVDLLMQLKKLQGSIETRTSAAQ